MEDLGNIVDYIDNMNIKTTAFGGFDKEAVYDVIQDLSSMYQKHISELQRENRRLNTELEQSSAAAPEDYRQSELSSLALEAAKREAEIKGERLKEAEAQIDRLKAELESAKTASPTAGAAQASQTEPAAEDYQQSFAKCSEKFELLDAAINSIKLSEEKIISEAKRNAEQIIFDANQKSSQILKSSEYMLSKTKREVEELKSLKSRIEASLGDVSFRLHDLYSRTEQLRHGAFSDGVSGGTAGADAMLFDDSLFTPGSEQ